uniref:Variant surface glycoprotein 1125.519 n=1 Tax=Trypanosoma brucei TaxID=5691 RepID=A0A1J0R4H9_9TRYP|nr:variant surface glycoprotein 1125.519 [Trypanosoma brucei]
MMKKPRFCLAALVMIVSLVERTAPAQENSKEFRDLCELFKLLRKPMPTVTVNDQPPGKPENNVPIEQAMNGIIARIKKLNLTVLEPDKEEVLKDKNKYSELSKIKDAKKDGYFESDNFKEVEEMRSVYGDLTKGNDDAKRFNSKFGLPLPEYRRAQLRPVFAQYMQRAIQLKQATANLIRQATTAAEQGRKAAIKALFGESYADKFTTPEQLKTTMPWTEQPETSNGPWPATGQHSDTCAGDAADGTQNKGGSCLATDIVCLCEGSNTHTINFCFTTALTGLRTAGTQAAVAGDWKGKIHAEFIKSNSAGDPKLTARAVETQISTIFANLGKGAIISATVPNAQAHSGSVSNTILGAHGLNSGAPECGGTQSNGDVIAVASKGVCVNYKKLLDSQNGIPWVVAARSVVAKLDEIQYISHKAATLISAANDLEQQMMAGLLLGNFLKQDQTSVNGAVNKQTTAEEQNKCNAATNKTAEGCEAIGCGYDENKKECKPKTGSETTAAETGQTPKEGATATGCASHFNDKDKCEKMNERKDKPVCAWKKGGEGDKDKDELRCRNGSVLVNEKLALSVVVVFICLVAYYNFKNSKKYC